MNRRERQAAAASASDGHSRFARWLASRVYVALSRLAERYSRRWALDVAWQAPLPDGPVMLAVNHPTSMDPFVVMSLLDRRLVFLTTYKLFSLPIFGRLLRAFGMVSAGGSNPLRAMHEAVSILSAGRTLCVFPEGRISPTTGGVGYPRSGPARIALQAQVPVVPIGIYASPEGIKRVSVRLKGHIETVRWYRHGPYVVTFGEPMQPDQLAPLGIRQVSFAIAGAIADLVEAGRQRAGG